MSKKSGRIAERIAGFSGLDYDPHYLGFFDCFNAGEYYEAHDVLEELWLGCRRGPDDLFYKGLIQLAGAFVHLQKERLKPSAALFTLAEANLRRYPLTHHGFSCVDALGLIEEWRGALQASDFTLNPLRSRPAPVLAPPHGPRSAFGT